MSGVQSIPTQGKAIDGLQDPGPHYVSPAAPFRSLGNATDLPDSIMEETKMQTKNRPIRGHLIGFVGILSVALFIPSTSISQLPEWVRMWSTIILFIGGEIAIAIGSVVTATTKERRVCGIMAALLGLFGLSLLFYLRPGLVPAVFLSCLGPIGFLVILALPNYNSMTGQNNDDTLALPVIQKRPTGVTIVSWVLIAISAVQLLTIFLPPMPSFVYAFIPSPQFLVFATLFSGIFMLKGAGWARWLYIASGAVGIVMTLGSGGLEALVLIVINIPFMVILFRKNSSEYFSRKQILFNKPAEPETSQPVGTSAGGESNSAPSTEIPWDYLKSVSSDNDTFFNDHKTSFPSIYTQIKGKGRDPILMLVAFEQEKWCALLALLYKRPQNLLFTPENVTQGKPTISNNGYCDVYMAPRVNGQTMQAGVYGLEREWLISEFCWVKNIPPFFIELIKSEMQPAGTFTVVNLAAGGMNVHHLPLP